MKKILLAVALLLSVTMMNAQPKNVQAAAAEVSKAVDAVQKAEQKASAKGKAVGPDVYIKLAKAYLDAYDVPTKNVMTGTTKQEIQLFLKDQQILSSEQKAGGDGVNYTVDHYADKDLWYNDQNILSSVVITKPALENVDALAEAVKAADKAAAEDTGKKKTKDISQLYENLHQRYTQDAFASYTASDFAKAAAQFEGALPTYENPVLNKVDSMSTYYSGIFESMAGNNEKAKGYYQKAIDLGYYSEGNAFSGLSNIYLSEGDTTKGTEILEQGFMKFPQSQSILVGLINIYLTSNQNPDKLFSLLHTAEANEPNNPSLYYVEGNVQKGLGKKDEAIACYHKANAADANYEYGYLGEGMLLYDEAVSISNAAQEELDDAKYTALMGKAEDCLKNAMEPFEQAFAVSKNEEVKGAIAEYLRNIYFRFREKSDDYMQKYEKYEALLKK
jgi:hypothetical protein